MAEHTPQRHCESASHHHRVDGSYLCSMSRPLRSAQSEAYFDLSAEQQWQKCRDD
jgi:hypothetical protein